MKKDLKKTSLFALVVFLILAFVVYEVNEFKKEVDVKETKDRVVRLPAEKIDRIEIANFILQKEGFVWRSIEGDFTDLLDKEKVDEWLSKSLGQDGRALSEPGEEVDWSKFGFDESSRKLVFKSGEDLNTVTISSMKSFDGGAYLKFSSAKGSETLYSSENEWFDFFKQDLNLLRSKKAFDWSLFETDKGVKSIKAKTDKKSLELVNKEGEWLSESERRQNWRFDESKVTSYLEDIKSFRLKDFVNERPKSLKKYGNLEIITNSGEYTLKVLFKDKDYYAESSFRPGVLYTLGQENVDVFFNSPWDLRSFDDALSFNQDKVTHVAFKKEKEEELIFKKSESKEWFVDSEAPEGKSFNGASLLKLFSLMKNVKVERYLTEKPTLSGSPLISVKNAEDDNKKQFEFNVFEKEVGCIEGDKTQKKDCIVLEANKLYLAVKKEHLEDLLSLEFFKEQTLEKAEIKNDVDAKKEMSAKGKDEA